MTGRGHHLLPLYRWSEHGRDRAYLITRINCQVWIPIVGNKNIGATQCYQELWCFHTRARQRQHNDKRMLNLCIPMMPFTPGVSCCRTWCERHHRNAQVQHSFVVVLSLSCSGVKTPLGIIYIPQAKTLLHTEISLYGNIMVP